MRDIALVLQIALGIFLTVAILLQSQDSGLGMGFGGGGSSESYHTRRGLEKILFRGTIAGTIVFAIVSVAVLLLS